ncbi:uncharacterized protein At3g49140-like isoform X2 [Telopea speciosissima]|uniref:uncharacterized protein At3g49140-like isoform X2 n=1 Tax=Telopea speciosissima TaxID=54955 RepID=UPI001CC628E3|nr:uncharacterized protein At3g49140-like isoform X2 [Telopea speciosissima]
MMTMIDSASAVGFCTGVVGGCCSSVTIANYRPFSSSDDSTGVHSAFRRLSHASCLDVSWIRARRLIDGCSFTMRNSLHPRTRVRATEEYSSSASDPLESNGRQNYHPYEEIAESTSQDGGDARLTAAETTRTLIEVNTEATLMFSALINDEVHENIFLPELPYVTDEHGNWYSQFSAGALKLCGISSDIYFRVNNDEGILDTLVSENNFVQVIIGLDTAEMLSEMDLAGPTDIDFGIEEITEGDGDDIDDDDEDDDDDDDDEDEDDWVAILEDEEGESDSDEALGDWAKLETMRSSHPMYFASQLAEAASDLPMDCIDQPPAGLAIQGLLRPAFAEEHPLIEKHISGNKSCKDDQNQVGKIDKLEGIGMVNAHHHESASSKDGSVWADGLEKAERVRPGTSFFKLEMIKIELISSHGHQTAVDVNDFQKARPDAIAHSAAQIISRLKDGGEKITQALKSLCWRCKGIKVEEVTVVGVDSLGFDLRVCSGTQVQNLRFAFNTRATSEYSAERQLHDLLFPRVQQAQKWQQAHQKEC